MDRWNGSEWSEFQAEELMLDLFRLDAAQLVHQHLELGETQRGCGLLGECAVSPQESVQSFLQLHEEGTQSEDLEILHDNEALDNGEFGRVELGVTTA